VSGTANDIEILKGADELNRLADALEKECASWIRDYNISDRPQFPSPAYEAGQEEEKRRRRCLWENAAAAGGVLLSLYDAGAFEKDSRIKNALGQMRAEMNRARRDNKAPLYNPGRKRPAWPGSQPWSESAREMFLVKIVEGLCKLWAKSYDDRRAFVSYYAPVKMKAALQIRMLRALSQKLREGCVRSGVC
jgi:hypothetical protein